MESSTVEESRRHDGSELEHKFLLTSVPRWMPHRRTRLVSTIYQGWFTNLRESVRARGKRSGGGQALVVRGVMLDVPDWVGSHLSHKKGSKLRVRWEQPQVGSLPPVYSVNVKRALKKGGTLQEWEEPIQQDVFEILWPHAELRLQKERRRFNRAYDPALMPCREAACDAFFGNLLGLVVVEVEFDDEQQKASFQPSPSWSPYRPIKVTDDTRFTNAALAVLSQWQAVALFREYYPGLEPKFR